MLMDEGGESDQSLSENSAEEIRSLNNVRREEVIVMSTLTNICLNSICKNIDRFNAAFHNSKDKIMKRNLFFLRRVYSSQIIKMLRGQRDNICLDKKYFDLLINEYLKELDFYIFGRDDLNIIMEMLPIMGKTLENVSFNFQDRFVPNEEETYLEHYVKKVLLHLTNVKVIRIMGFSNCNDSTLEVIYSYCKELKQLYLHGCPITSAGLKSLCPEDKRDNTFNLKSLSLMLIRDCDEGVSYLLKNLPSLENIAYTNLPNVLHKLHADDLRNNSLINVPKYNLTSLHIDASINFQHNMESFVETLLIASELCPRVSKICVIGIQTEKQLQILSKFPDLSLVSIDGDRNSLDIGDFLLHTGKKMRNLEIKRFKLTLSTLVENCPNLESLGLDNIKCYFSEKENSVNILRNMRKLILVCIDENNETAEMNLKLLLDSCPNLDDLQFINSSCDALVTKGIIPIYCKNSETLEKLTFRNCTIEEAALQQIVLTCTPLKELVIYSCEIIGSQEIENLRDIIRVSNSGVVVDFTSKSDFFNSSDEDYGDFDDLDDEDVDDFSDDEDVDDFSDDIWGGIYYNDMEE